MGKNKEITSNGPPMLLKERCTEYFDQVAHNIETWDGMKDNSKMNRTSWQLIDPILFLSSLELLFHLIGFSWPSCWLTRSFDSQLLKTVNT